MAVKRAVPIQLIRVTDERDGIQVVAELDVATKIYGSASTPVSIVPATGYTNCHSVVAKQEFPPGCFQYGRNGDQLSYDLAREVAEQRLSALFGAPVKVDPTLRIAEDREPIEDDGTF